MRSWVMLALIVLTLGSTGCVAVLDVASSELGRDGPARPAVERRSEPAVVESDDGGCACGHSECDGHHRTTVTIVHSEEG